MRRSFFVTLFALMSFWTPVEAAYMSPISDLIVSSQPSTSTPHILTFTVTNAIPPSGTITITPESAFSIPVSFGSDDVDLAVSSGGPYVERDLAAAAGAAVDGVSVVSGSAGSVTLTLNSTTGISAGDLVRVVLGTAATHQTAGSVSPINPASPGSYRIRVETGNGVSMIDVAKAMIVVILPVTLGVQVNENFPIISNALPTGTIPAGSNFIELSFQTDVAATCRYATSTGIAYASMSNSFTNIAGLLHYRVVSGHDDGATYHYYIRCRDTFGATATSDYDLSFSLASTPTITSSDGNTPGVASTGAGGGAGGSGGSGPFAGGSALLFLSNVTISGKAPPGTAVTMLRDGKIELTVQTSATGAFTGRISGLERGTYTFVTYASDPTGKKTSRFSSTLTLGSGTNNDISNVYLSPTIATEIETVDVGEPVPVSGLAIPGSIVGLVVRNVPKSGATGIPLEYSASSSVAGSWSMTVPAKDLARGTYEFRVKTIMPEASSEYSAPIYVGYGESPSQKADTGNRSDINKDGKVNLVDFSILLTHWGDDDEDSDINEDGAINLSDFSILLFNWTG
ncbi:MAG: hypothetical protein KBD06_03075 [Candidatus Pacebacteria bacterium]|nr:hypothetical protein [Candidatus Paceibacterota bacterium]